jgi:hypothetical protein
VWFVLLSRDDAAPDLLLRQRDLELPPGPGPVDVVVSLSVIDIVAEHDRLRRQSARITVPLSRQP